MHSNIQPWKTDLMESERWPEKTCRCPLVITIRWKAVWSSKGFSAQYKRVWEPHIEAEHTEQTVKMVGVGRWRLGTEAVPSLALATDCSGRHGIQGLEKPRWENHRGRDQQSDPGVWHRLRLGPGLGQESSAEDCSILQPMGTRQGFQIWEPPPPPPLHPAGYRENAENNFPSKWAVPTVAKSPMMTEL